MSRLSRLAARAAPYPVVLEDVFFRALQKPVPIAELERAEVVAVVNTVLSLFYYLRVIAVTMFKPLEGEVHMLGTGSWLTLLASGVLLIAASLGAEAGLGLASALRFVS
ncbi:hypothetical protein [Halomonas sp. H10-9-1]|uniref:hypothetical protein n=1 Tax=Halomonas sp. H10-9-1 TaxID=2950871 RepID=UPI0032DE35FE